MYPLLRDLLFCVSPEKAHYFSMNCLQEACNFEILKQAIRKHFSYDNPSLERNVFGLHFKNPVGLGAGFDKNAAYLRELSTLGFGFVEVGTITPTAQLGNLKPRLFRLPKDQALINRMGFNNDGVETVNLNSYKNKAKTKLSNSLELKIIKSEVNLFPLYRFICLHPFEYITELNYNGAGLVTNCINKNGLKIHVLKAIQEANLEITIPN